MTKPSEDAMLADIGDLIGADLPPLNDDDQPEETDEQVEQQDDTDDDATKEHEDQQDEDDKQDDDSDEQEEEEEDTEEDTEEDKEEETTESETERLRRLVEEIAAKQFAAQKGQKPAEKREGAEEEQAPAELISDEDIELAQTDPQAFKRLVSKVYKEAAQKAAALAVQEAQKLAASEAQRYATLASMTVDFYSKNRDLQPFRKFVGLVADEMVAEKPDMPLDELFSKLGDEVRKRLNLQRTKVAQDKRNKKFTKPPKKSAGTKTKTQELTPEEEEIMDLIT